VRITWYDTFENHRESTIRLMLAQHQGSTLRIQKELSGIVEKDPTLRNDMNQLLSVSCDCENKELNSWHFPVICTVLYPFYVLAAFASILISEITGQYFPIFYYIIGNSVIMTVGFLMLVTIFRQSERL
jgi:hypothetical protein